MTDDELAALFVRHLGLLMVDCVRISDKVVLREPHKGSRSGSRGAASSLATGSSLIELSHPIHHGMVTLHGLAALPPQRFRFHAAPPLIAGMGTFPVRAYAVGG